jgi:alanine racemase
VSPPALRALARVDLRAISANCERLSRAVGPGTRLAAVVKADGYGHGAAPAARAAQAGGAQWLAVATAGEAAGLRTAGIEGPILVMGALAPEELSLAIEAGADVVAWREAFVSSLPRNTGVGVHVKLDTGMGRLGTRDAGEATVVARAVGARDDLRLAGAMTHFATADEDPGFLAEQLAAFEPWARAIRAEFGPEVLVHAANSAATLREPATHFDLVRCGIAIYGMDPFGADPAQQGLAPALELRSYVAEVKPIAPGQSAGYGRRFVADEPTWLGTVPIGYGDGVRRGLTGTGAELVVEGARYPLVGTVSMDNVTIDLGPDGARARALRGAPAILLGAGILAEDWARRLDTINYEVTCAISSRVPREYA